MTKTCPDCDATVHAFLAATPAVGGEIAGIIEKMQQAMRGAMPDAYRVILTLDERGIICQALRAYAAPPASQPAVGWTPDPKAPWRCLICGSERSACTCLPRERATPAVGGEYDGPDNGIRRTEYYVPACTCHPDDNPPIPCAQKYALSECKATQPASPLRGREWTARAMQGANALRMQQRDPWDDLEASERDHWLYLADAALASPPEQPALRELESVRQIAHRHCTCTCRGDPEVLQNHTNLCDEISDAILEYAVLSSAAPEQPAASLRGEGDR